MYLFSVGNTYWCGIHHIQYISHKNGTLFLERSRIFLYYLIVSIENINRVEELFYLCTLLRCSHKKYNFFFHFQMMDDTPLLVNIKGCGYPPDIACPRFASQYNDTWHNKEVIQHKKQVFF